MEQTYDMVKLNYINTLLQLVKAKRHHAKTGGKTNTFHQGQLALDLEQLGKSLGLPLAEIDNDIIFPEIAIGQLHK